ncbi:MAG: hypothetical protein KGJ23_06360 [Euryarchaeota archaeon]|nr:hypothetical protein [Euryarchaeota archaeon]MDE1836223.1 hypothetical protein [Euryarchaeota archaeon]MDE1880876.1 hypothetical protein [Euryarchaeota archaeon]MDE2045016.1 hypothetical protein [Thermoplasmata archaeon]
MESYLRVAFSSEGSKPSEIADKLHALGFRPTQGNYDFIYDWKAGVKLEEAMDLADEVSRTLRGFKVLFEMETV